MRFFNRGLFDDARSRNGGRKRIIFVLAHTFFELPRPSVPQACTWTGMTFLGYTAYMEGNPQVLIGGLQWDGKICGYNKGVRNKYNWELVSWMGEGICREDCPTTTTDFNMNWFDQKNIKYLTCKDYNQTDEENDYLEDLENWYLDFPFFLVYYGDCMLQFQSTAYLGFCIFVSFSRTREKSPAPLI